MKITGTALLQFSSFAQLASTLLACHPCDRDGCDAFARPVTGAAIATGIAGIAASMSDFSADDCGPKCPLSGGTIYIWAAPAPITAVGAATALAADMPTYTIDVDERYEQALPPGQYLACHSVICAPFGLSEGEVVTVSIKSNYGGVELHVFLPGTDDPVATLIVKDAWSP